MANPNHVAILQRGAKAWNRWRDQNPQTQPDLTGADLSGLRLHRIDFKRADLSGARLAGARLRHATFTKAILRRADLSEASLSRASLRWADCREAQFIETNLKYSSLVGTKVEGAVFFDCRIFGASVWRLQGNPARQENLIISRDKEARITVDNLKVAQFMHLLLANAEIREVIDTLRTKVVLILGRFTGERMAVLQALRERLREKKYSPVLFDFEKPLNLDTTETVRLIAHMARFVIADLTDARSVPHELMAFVHELPSVPVQPLILRGQEPYGMFEHFRRYDWVLREYVYKDLASLLEALPEKVIAPAEAKVAEQTRR